MLKAKSSLKKSSKFEKVFIENDLPLHQRIINNNNRALLKAVGKDKEFMIKSGRVVRKSDNTQNSSQPTEPTGDNTRHNTRDREYTNRRPSHNNNNNRPTRGYHRTTKEVLV